MDRYEIIRQLGQGGMGAVYEVEDRETGERLAMKTMLGGGARPLLRFKREFRAVAEFDHPNLVRLFDLGVKDEAWYFTMELINGVDLLEAIHEQSERERGSRPQAPGVETNGVAPLAATEVPTLFAEAVEAAPVSTRLITGEGFDSEASTTIRPRPLGEEAPRPSEQTAPEKATVVLSRQDKDLAPHAHDNTQVFSDIRDGVSPSPWLDGEAHTRIFSDLQSEAQPSTVPGDDEDSTRVLSPIDRGAHASPPLASVGHGVAHQAGVQDDVTWDLSLFKTLILQVLDALQFLHGQGLIHRDLKPSNIMVDEHGDVKLLDFGLVSHVDRSQAISRTGTMAGTVAYMAPEQFSGEAVTFASDMYALGCIMFQLLTGRLPLQGDIAQVINARLHAPPPRVEDHIRGIPPEISALCSALMSLDPGARPSIEQVRQTLDSSFASTPHPDVLQRLSKRDPIPFIGRVAELERVDVCLTRALEGETPLVLIEGDPGIGKTALLERCLQQARRKGLLCFRGRCFERERLPFAALDRAIDAMIVTLSRWTPEQLAPLQETLCRLVRMFPAMAMLIAEESAPLMARARATRATHEETLQDFCALLTLCQRQTPLLFALDDLHWADEESVDMLQYVFDHHPGKVCFIETICSSQDPSRRTLSASLRGSPRRASSVTRLCLGPLRQEESAQLIEAAGRGRLDPTAIEALSTHTEGNPSLTLQLIDHIAKLDDESRRVYLKNILQSGRAIGAILEQRTLPARRLLELISLAGQPLEEHILHEASALDSAAFEGAINELTSARLIRYTQGAPAAMTRRSGESARPSLELEHGHFRATIREQIPPPSARRLHRALALAMAADDALRTRSAERVIMHFREARFLEEIGRVAREAADAAEKGKDFSRAGALMKIALEVSAQDTDPERLATEWDRTGQHLDRAGLRAASIEAYTRALALREQATPDKSALSSTIALQGRLAESLLLNGQIEEGLKTLRRSFASMGVHGRPNTPTHQPVLLGLLALAVLFSLLPVRWIGRKKERPDAVKLEYYAIIQRVLMPLWPLIAVEATLRSLILGLKTQDQPTLHRMLCARTLPLLYARKHTPRAIQKNSAALDRAEQLTREHEIPLGVERVMLYRAAHTLLTDPARARRLMEEAMTAFEREGVTNSAEGTPAIGVYLACLFQSGDLEELLRFGEKIIQNQSDIINSAIAYSTAIHVHGIRNNMEEARRLCEASMEIFESLPHCALTCWLHSANIRLLLMQGRFNEALLLGDVIEDQWREARFSPGRHSTGMWLEPLLEAALGLLKNEQLSPWRVIQTHRRARRLSRLRSFDHDCVGHRARALINHYTGKTRAARRHLQRALELSSARRSSPFRRWLCLEGAREMGQVTLDLESEARALQTRHGFTLAPTAGR